MSYLLVYKNSYFHYDNSNRQTPEKIVLILPKLLTQNLESNRIPEEEPSNPTETENNDN